MKYWLSIAPCALAMASCALNASSGQDSIRRSVESFERVVKLPYDAYAIEKYARYYKFVKIPYKDYSSKMVNGMYFVYLYDGRPGVYIIADSDDLPGPGWTDGGCRAIYGVFKMDDVKVFNLECGPLR